MHIARHTVHIDRAPETVFDYFTDFSKAPLWRQYVESLTPAADGPLRAGSKINAVINLMGDRTEFEMTVLALQRPTLWRHRTDETDFNGYIEYRFDPEGAGTRVTLTMEAKPAGIWGWLAMPMLLLRREKPYRDQLPRLKQAVEAAA